MSKTVRTRRITVADFPNWNTRKKILIILAHPDDPEFFCGATLAKWAREGHQISYCLLTHGEKGTNAEFSDSAHIKEIRKKEQNAAASIIGAQKVLFLEHPDGFLVADLGLRKELVRIMRGEQPDVVVSCDPSNFYIHGQTLNHPDHRAAGLAVVEAIFPATQNNEFYPELMVEGLEQHHIQELWLSLPHEANLVMDVTDTWQIKIEALLKHRSQVGDPGEFRKQMESRGKMVFGKKKYFEQFHRLVIRK